MKWIWVLLKRAVIWQFLASIKEGRQKQNTWYGARIEKFWPLKHMPETVKIWPSPVKPMAVKLFRHKLYTYKCLLRILLGSAIICLSIAIISFVTLFCGLTCYHEKLINNSCNYAAVLHVSQFTSTTPFISILSSLLGKSE